MNNLENENKELFLKKFEKLSMQIEKIADDVNNMKNKVGKGNQMNRSFGLKVLRNSQPLDFAKDVMGLGSPTKRYIMSMRAISEEWKGKKNDILISIRQQEAETHMDLKSLGIRIPINDIKNIRILAREIISLLYISCELKGVEITDMLRDILQDVNKNGPSMLKEIRQKMSF